MKKILSLLLLISSLAHAQQITTGYTPVDGQRLTAAQLLQMVNQATINTIFYTGAVQHNTNLLASDIMLLVTSGGVFQQITGSQIINNPAIFTSQALLSYAPGYVTFLYYNPSNLSLVQIALTNLSQAIASNITVSNFFFARTNSGSTNILNQVLLPYTNTPSPFSTNNQAQFLVWDTNGIPYEISLSNLLSAAASGLVTNFERSVLYSNVFSPWSLGVTNTFTNAWGTWTNFPITNLFFTNSVLLTNTSTITNQQTLTNSDSFPIYATSQGTNTTATLQALYEYLTNRNALPAYAIARCQFNGNPLQVNVTNVNNTGTNLWFFATNNGLAGLQAVSFKFTVASSTSLPSSPQIVSNQVYYVQNVNASNFMLFTNYSDAVNYVHPIQPTGAASTTAGQVVLLYLTNYTALNADAIQLCTTTSLRTGTYDICYRTNLTTSNYYFTSSWQQTTDATTYIMAISADGIYTTNKMRIQTLQVGVGQVSLPRVEVLIQPE